MMPRIDDKQRQPIGLHWTVIGPMSSNKGITSRKNIKGKSRIHIGHEANLR